MRHGLQLLLLATTACAIPAVSQTNAANDGTPLAKAASYGAIDVNIDEEAPLVPQESDPEPSGTRPSRSRRWKKILAGGLLATTAIGANEWTRYSQVMKTFPDCIAETCQPPPADWVAHINKAKMIVADLTLEEKVGLASGTGFGASVDTPCVGNIAPIATSTFSFPGLCLQDGPSGIRYQNATSSSFPAGVAIAMTWDKDLMRRHGEAMGREFRGKGINAALTPMMNIGRIPEGGRNWEGFGEDPYLTGIASAQVVIGVQNEGVMAVAKHFYGYSEIGNRALHEIYLPPFEMSIKAGVSSVMCSYNRVKTPNGELEYACAHGTAQNKILKGELGFQGFIMSDWWSVKSFDRYKSAVNGLDMMMPGGEYFGAGPENPMWGNYLVKGVREGHVPETRVDDMATRILAAYYRLGQDQAFPRTNIHSFIPELDEHVNVRSEKDTSLIRETGAASIVMLKNVEGILPLQTSSSMKLFGLNAKAADDPNEIPDRAGVNGHVGIGWGSGSTNFPYLVGPFEGMKAMAQKAGGIIAYSETFERAGSDEYDYAVVSVYANSGEAYLNVDGNQGDRKDLKLWDNGDRLIKEVAQIYENVIVIITSPGPIDMSAWISNKNVKESGNAFSDVIFGAVNPSGRLPFTIAASVDQYPATTELKTGIVRYTEGIFVGYRHFEKYGLKPAFPFGYGLSYTTFAYSKLELKNHGDYEYTVSILVENTGTVDGHEVVQLYIGLPESTESAPRNLKGFERVFVESGKTVKVEFELDFDSFKYWQEISKTEGSWQVAPGTYKIYVGRSSGELHDLVVFDLE